MLTNLRLRDFRCFENLAVDLACGANFFLGPNAQGKTTILGGVRSTAVAIATRFFARARDSDWKKVLRLARDLRRSRAGVSLWKTATPGQI